MLFSLITVLVGARLALSAPLAPINYTPTTEYSVDTVAVTITVVPVATDGNLTQTTPPASGTIDRSAHPSLARAGPITTTLSPPAHASMRPTKFRTPVVHMNKLTPTLSKLKARFVQALQIRSQSSVDPSACAPSWPNGKPDFNTAPSSCGVSWLDTINTWRQAYHKPTLSWSPRLAEIAWNAGVNNQGGAQSGGFQHTDLRSVGSYGETEIPGYVVPPPGLNLFGSTPFEGAVLAWLCEVPGPELYRNGVDLCNQLVKQTNSINVAGQRGHHDAFLGDYKQIGCSFTFNTRNPQGLFAGAYVCDYGH